MTSALERPPPAQAGPELRVLALWEEFLAWFWLHTGRWPKSVRFTLTQRLQNLALDVQHDLVQARYRRRGRPAILEEVNLRLEQMRYLCRLAQSIHVLSKKSFETTMRHLDETGRMVYGWRQTLAGGRAKGRTEERAMTTQL